MNEQKIAHLNMLQSVVARMANNSFLIKGWVIAIAAALIALFTNKANPAVLYLAIFAVLMLWWLDGYYLHLERCYRDLYDAVANDTFVGQQFCLSVSAAGAATGVVRAIFSLVTVPFYLAIILLITWNLR